MERVGRSGFLAVLITLVGLVLAAGAAPARAQTAEDVLSYTKRSPATGARMMGMAGAGGVAGLGDYTALYYNPAGLGWMHGSQAAGAIGGVSTEDQARFDAGLESGVQTRTVGDVVGNAALVYEFPTQRGSLVFAAGYNQVSTFGRELSFRGDNNASSITDAFLPQSGDYRLDGEDIVFSSEPGGLLPFVAYEAGAIEFFPGEADADNYPFEPAVFPNTVVEQTGQVSEGGRLGEASLGAGVEAARGVMLGLSANFSFGTYRFENVYEEIDTGGNDDYVVIRGDDVYAGLEAVQFRENFESELRGGSLRGGLSAEAAPGLRVGATIETPTFYRVNETYTEADVTTFFDEGGSLSYGGRPEQEGFGEFKYDVRTPWRFGGGLAFNTEKLTRGVADLTLSADLELVDWSQLELDSEFDDFAGVNRRIRDRYEAVVNTRVGAELDLGNAALRAGFAARPDPRDLPQTEGAATRDRDRIFFSAGLGYRFSERLQVDVGWMREQFDDRYQPYGDVASRPGFGGAAPAPVVDEEVSRNRFSLGLQYAL